MDELEIRSLSPGEADLFHAYPHPTTPEVGYEARINFDERLQSGEYRPEHTWVAIRDGVVVARAVWWTGPNETHPVALDWLEAVPGPEQARLGALLLQAAHVRMRTAAGERPEYHLLLPVDWRERADIRRAAEARIESAASSGLRPFVERFSLRWTQAADGLPERTTRLRFAEADDDAFLPALRAVLEGTFDAYDRRAIAEHGLDAAAATQLRDLHWFPSPRSWWQLAYTHAGELAGLIVPARNYTNATVGYIGVRPGHRGRGYVNDLLSEMMWRFTELAPGEEVGADTDFGNWPMVRAFAKAGFRTVAARIVMTERGMP